MKYNKIKTFGINSQDCWVCKSKNSNHNRWKDTLSERHIMVGFGVFRKRSVFLFFFFELLGDAELHSYFCGFFCEVHSVHDAAYLWPPSISFIDCIHNTCCLIWELCELPHLPCFCCTCHLCKMMTCMTLIYSHPWSGILNCDSRVSVLCSLDCTFSVACCFIKVMN